MARGARQVYEAGLELDADDRAVVAHRLLASLHEQRGDDQAAIDAAWQDEIGSRIGDILSGNARWVSWAVVRQQAHDLLPAAHT